MDLTRFNKAIYAAIGALVTVGVAWLATKTPLAECAIVNAKQVCTFLGLSTLELTAIIAPIIVGAITGFAPKNTVTPIEAIKEVEALPMVEKVKLDPRDPEAIKINNETSDKVTIGP